ncbi:hypothetical protein RFI_01914, partial [Reticulomyxa filosa]
DGFMILINLLSNMLSLFVLFYSITRYFIVHNIIQATNFFTFDVFRSLSKLLKTFTGHTDWVNSIDYFTFNGGQLFVLDQMIQQFINISNHYMFSMDMKILLIVLIFHHYKVITITIKVIALDTICSGSFDITVSTWEIEITKQCIAF